MEMPEGWVNAIKAIKDMGVGPDGLPNYEGLHEAYKVLVLIKEMAEALESCDEDIRENYLSYHSEQLVPAALKKFYEWK